MNGFFLAFQEPRCWLLSCFIPFTFLTRLRILGLLLVILFPLNLFAQDVTSPPSPTPSPSPIPPPPASTPIPEPAPPPLPTPNPEPVKESQFGPLLSFQGGPKGSAIPI